MEFDSLWIQKFLQKRITELRAQNAASKARGRNFYKISVKCELIFLARYLFK